MVKLGIIGAMEVEVKTLRSSMKEAKITEKAGMVFCEGFLEGVPAVVARCGVGKVQAALCAQILCVCFGVSHIVNTGIAGALGESLEIGDLVVSLDAMYHDFDCGPVGYPLGQVPGMPLTFAADETLIGYAFAAGEKVFPGHVKTGRIASGDQFVSGQEMKKKIVETTKGLCTEMEGTAIAQAAYINKVPFVILRVISDKADDSAQVDYPVFEAEAAKRCAAVTTALAAHIHAVLEEQGSIS